MFDDGRHPNARCRLTGGTVVGQLRISQRLHKEADLAVALPGLPRSGGACGNDVVGQELFLLAGFGPDVDP
jgi:hypothetical protein